MIPRPTRINMKFAEDNLSAENRITRYGSGFIEVGQQRFEHGILVFPDTAVRRWNCASIDQASQENLREIIDYQPELVLIGSGETFGFPDFALQAWLQQRRIGCEVMDSAAACRTFNVLVSEQRNVAAALLLP
ncbi:MAG TPA: hypothetical protein ENK26_12095 [Gammaproteobacteria bacterium]|nr:hypothetical protein [Gammaproteobacteria bacterium]